MDPIKNENPDVDPVIDPEMDGDVPVTPIEPKKDEPPEYTADYSYKVYDDMREIPEFYRPLITDKESEEQVRQLFCKADGLEGVKTKYERAKTDRDAFKAESLGHRDRYDQANADVQAIDYYKKNDLGALFNHVGLTKGEVFDWAEAEIDSDTKGTNRDSARRTQNVQDSWTQQQGAVREKQQAAEMFNQQHNLALQNTMMAPDNGEVVKKVDTMFGEGTFLNEVKLHGQQISMTQNRYVYPDEAVKAVHGKYVNMFNHMAPPSGVSGAGSHGATSPGFTPPAAPKAPPAAPPPSMGSGSGKSPTAKQPSSIKELREMSQNMSEG